MKTLLILPMLSVAILLGGCASLHTVNVATDPTMAGASVTVDVIPVTDASAAVETVSVHDYWEPGNPLRKSVAHDTLQFGAGQPTTQAVTKDWKSLHAKKVAVLADLPGVFQDAPGDADARRKTLPVKNAEKVNIRITSSGLLVETGK